MKITHMTESRLTPADLQALQRIRQNLIRCQLAYLNEQVAVMLLTDETDPVKLLGMAQEQMRIALNNHPDFECYSTSDGHNLVALTNGLICAFGKGDDDMLGSLSHRLALRGMALAACEQERVLAIVTGEDADVIDMAPGA